MARPMLRDCPNCGGRLEATRLECAACDTAILARYDPCRFCSLSPESLRFAEAFLRYRGNLKEMERELGESYWTLRTRLSEVIKEMGFDAAEPAPAPEEPRPRRRRILDKLEAGEIGAGEAAEMLADLGRRPLPPTGGGR